MVRTYGRVCFKDVEELSLELGGSLNGLLLGSCLAGICGAFLRTQEERPMRTELCRRSEGSTGWPGRSCPRSWPWLGRFLPKLAAPEVSTVRGKRCSLDKSPSATTTGQEWIGWRKGFSATNLTPPHCTGPEAKHKPLRHCTWGRVGGRMARRHRPGRGFHLPGEWRVSQQEKVFLF
jgi:hypothetical protein